jgi:predicted Rossmann-fold nucleotide-binding protein
VLESIVLSCRKQPSRTSIGKHKIELVYGANVGLMGAVADGVLNGGGTVIGVILILRSKEIAHNGLTELIVVDSMHERKTKMNDL